MNDKAKQFLENKIELIDKDDWHQFFEDMIYDEYTDLYLNNNEAIELIEFLKKNEINFNEDARVDQLIEAINTTMQNLFEGENIKDITLENLYSLDNGNWAGYTLTEFSSLLNEYAEEMGIEITFFSDNNHLIAWVGH